ncbi:MAG TPA: amidohydrolase family protein [Bacteroidota bacterium]|nr:amidohydrolase family protein [Bacteroidota bacterium]
MHPMSVVSRWVSRTAPLALLCAGTLFAQTTPVEGIRKNTPAVYAFINARIVKAPGEVIESGTLVIRDGIIESVGNVPVPKDATVRDLKGMWVYPGFIDAYTDYGMPQPLQRTSGGVEPPGQRAPVAEGQRGPTHWNTEVLSHLNAADLFVPDAKTAEKLRSQGFAAALIVPPRGIFRGSSAVVSLGDGKPGELILRSPFAQHISLALERLAGRYPTSLMGLIALVRQTFYDSQWYRSATDAFYKNPSLPRPETNSALAALFPVLSGSMPVVIETSDELDLLRAEKIAGEFKLNLIVRGSGTEYRRLEAVKAAHRAIILPVNFPEAPAVQTPEEELQVSLSALRYWDEAPDNPRHLHDAGIPFAFTSAGLKDQGQFLSQLRKAVTRGLAKDDALAALTTTSAQLLGLEKQLGALERGKTADFIVTSGDIFSEKTVIRESWIDGKRYEIRPSPEVDPRGSWRLTIAGITATDSLILSLKGEPESLQGTMKRKKVVPLGSAAIAGLRLVIAFQGDSIGYQGSVRMTANVEPHSLDGTGEWPDGTPFAWSAVRIAPFVPVPDTSKSKPPEAASFMPVYPPGEFGRTTVPEQPAVVMVRNATIWTCGPQGVLENSDVIFRNGKVQELGKSLPVPAGAILIEGKGKHVTPGIIDCHSHMAGTGNLNESGFAISAEVRVGDVINCDDINLYRNLAGGLTVAHVLHGSANPIGGQNQLIKLRWGMLPEEMKFEGWVPTIKFALGENVKQSNWYTPTARYPQTREGVEQIMRDEFRAALDYEREWRRYQETGEGIPPRRNLQLDAIVEVLHGRMFVHCHSYRQDEILTMMRVAEDFGFRIRAFQHVLEGYKVADVLAKHGAGGSSFSDWWAYKFEVYDAIPYNGAIMHDQGVLVSFNSDSDELSRRLNLEAAKAVKYGGISEVEALKFVTINPAKQLFIDSRVGSLEPGKDADFVIWSGHPLSNYTICEQTWIDGRRFFDREEDRDLYERAMHERSILVQKVLQTKKGAEGERPSGKGQMGSDRSGARQTVQAEEE